MSKQGKLTHIEHSEDHMFHTGHEGVNNTIGVLWHLHNSMREKVVPGSRPSAPPMSRKVDGSPSMVFGHVRDPETGELRFHVGTKSTFNKTPKLNFTPKDIDRNHGHAPGLADALKHALRHLPKITKDTGLYQGDLMYKRGDVHREGGEMHIRPNTLTYSVPQNSYHGRRMAKAQMGISVHTQYTSNHLPDAQSEHPSSFPGLQDHPDVHLIDNSMSDFSSEHYAQSHANQFKAHMHNAHLAAEKAADSHQHLTPLLPHIRMYANQTSNAGENMSSHGFVSFLQSRSKTNGGKDSPKKIDSLVQHASEHSTHLDNVFHLHHHLQQAKNALIPPLARNSLMGGRISIDGAPAKEEGHVTKDKDGGIHKIVHRQEFSAANRARNDARMSKQLGEDLDTGTDAHDYANPHTEHKYVFAGKTGLITKAGHGRAVEHMVRTAASNGHGPHQCHILVSSSYKPGEGSDHPIKPEDKLRFSRQAAAHHGIPPENVQLSRSPIADVADSVGKGAHIHLFAGSDRVEKYKSLGKGNEEFHVHEIPRDERDGVSASAIRKKVRTGQDISGDVHPGIDHKEYAKAIMDGSTALKESYILSRLRDIING